MKNHADAVIVSHGSLRRSRKLHYRSRKTAYAVFRRGASAKIRSGMEDSMIGEIIRKYRKIKNITQEEMANRLGVTASAVNKWEKGASLPDISLLAPIARLLGITPDTLLSFNETLTNEEIAEIIKDIDNRFRTDFYDDTFNYASQIINKYPNCYQLIWQLAVVLDAQNMMNGAEENADFSRYEEQIAKWYILASECEDAVIRRNAAGSLFQYYLRKENYEEAQKYISFFSEESTERKRMQAELYSRTGQINEAYKAYEEILFSEYQILNFVFNSLYILAADENNTEQAKMWIDRQISLHELFDMGQYRSEACKLDLAVYLKDSVQTLKSAKALLASVPHLCDFSGSPLYSHMKFKPVDEDFYINLAKSLITHFCDADEFDYMQGNAEWERLINQ